MHGWLLEGLRYFDPSAKRLVESLVLHQGQLVLQLRDRGIQSSGTPTQNLSLGKRSAMLWARVFAKSHQESVVPYCQTVDRALVPFFQACEAAYEALRQYLKERLETP